MRAWTTRWLLTLVEALNPWRDDALGWQMMVLGLRHAKRPLEIAEELLKKAQAEDRP